MLIPKKTTGELGVRENDTIVIRKIEKPMREIRGILKGSDFEFKREHNKDHDF